MSCDLESGPDRLRIRNKRLNAHSESVLYLLTMILGDFFWGFCEDSIAEVRTREILHQEKNRFIPDFKSTFHGVYSVEAGEYIIVTSVLCHSWTNRMPQVGVSHSS